MGRCPLCRARLNGPAVCPRCGADLTLAQAAEAQAARYLHQALVAHATRDRHRAEVCVRNSLRLQRTPLSEVIAHWLADTAERAE